MFTKWEQNPVTPIYIHIHNTSEERRFKYMRKTVNIGGKIIGENQPHYIIAEIGINHNGSLETAKKIIDKRNDITFLAIGERYNFEKCRRMIGKKYKANFKFLGRQTEIESIINILDIGVLSTNRDVHGEGISNSIIEYMSLGKPVIATKGGGTNEIVYPGVNGLLCEDKQIIEMSDSIEYLIDNERIAKNMEKRGKNLIMKKFDIKIMVDRYLEIYSELFSS